MKILLFAVLCALAVASGWIGFELRAIRKILQARWDYERYNEMVRLKAAHDEELPSTPKPTMHESRCISLLLHPCDLAYRGQKS